MKIWLTAALLTLTLPALAASSSDSDYKDESPPAAEYPQPNAPEPGFTKPKVAPSRAATAPIGKSDSTQKSVPKPIKETEDGGYEYGTENSSDATEYGVSDSKDSTLYYPVKHKSRGSSAGFSFGYFGPPDITNPANNVNFKTIYGGSNIPTVFFNYEWRLFRFPGELGLKVGTGVFFATGTGRWADSSRQSDPQQPIEKFTFLMFPNTAGAIYHFRYADKQLIVPYVEGGGGYFTFMELRNDSVGPKFGAAPAAYVLGGVSILMDWADRRAMGELLRDYGIRHLFLNLEVREMVGLDSKYDFSSRVLAGGLNLEF